MSKVVGYYASWAHYRQGAGKYTLDDIPVQHFSHLVYAFAALDPVSLKIKEHDTWLDKDDGLSNYRKFVELRQRNPRVKMLLAIGGWNDSKDGNKYSRLVSSKESRAAFISHAIQFLKSYGFDGLDLDWEYPESAADKRGFTSWVEELKRAFVPHGLLLTAAVSGSKQAIDQGYDVPALANALDMIHIMTYDFHGSWENQVGHHAPLSASPGQSRELTVDFAVSYWINKGAAPSKLVMGVPFYGRSWTLAGAGTAPGKPAAGPGKPGPLVKEAGMLAYYEIIANEHRGWRKIDDAGGPYMTNDDQWVGYDDVPAIKRKTQYAKSKGLGGVMIWDITMDDFQSGGNPLTRAIANAL